MNPEKKKYEYMAVFYSAIFIVVIILLMALIKQKTIIMEEILSLWAEPIYIAAFIVFGVICLIFFMLLINKRKK